MKIKRVGILTFHRALNYGAVLQTYALQRAVCRFPVECEVVDYRSEAIEEQYRKIFVSGSIKSKIKRLLLFKQLHEKDKKFISFLLQHVVLSPAVYRSKAELLSANDRYDSFITGSDQVWNPVCTGFDSSYFLDFVSPASKKNSYAASFGMESLPEKYSRNCAEFLTDFHGISVREATGKKIVLDLAGRQADVNLDPVFLLRSDEWRKIARFPGEQGYVLVYLMQRSEKLLETAQRLAAESGRKILYLCNGLRRPIHAEYVKAAGPLEFIGLISNAGYVVTNSFHGMAFSILFHKRFYIELLHPPAAVNSRVENLLDLLSLRGCQITDETEIESDQSIDYRQIDLILEKESFRSMDYLKNILGIGDE